MRKHGRAVRKQGRSWGKQGKTEAAGGRRGRQAGENRKGTSRIGEGPGRKGDGPWKYRGGAGKKQGRTGKEAARTGKDLGTTDWENRRREESGRELATKTEPEKIREGMEAGKKHGKTWRGTSKHWEGPGKNLEGTGKDQRSELHHATNLLSIQFDSTYMQQCIYYFMLSVSVLDQVFVYLFYLGSWCAFLCLLGATWMQKRFKRGIRVILLDSKS